LKKSNYFQNLNYTLGDEDSIVEYELLPEGIDHVVAIAGSGGRILPLLAKRPAHITCIDILDEQLYLTELRIQAMKKLDLDKFRAFLGYPPFTITPEERKLIFDGMDLSEDARKYLYRFFSKHKWTEIIYMGKFEKTMATLSKINVLVTGKSGRNIFKSDNLTDQQVYYKSKFPQSRWKAVLFLLGNTTVLNTLLYKGDFPKKNIEGSYYNNFRNIYHSIFSNIWINSSFFAHLSFWGKVINIEGNPIEADERIFNLAKSHLDSCEVTYLKNDIVKFIANSPAKSIDFVSLSDVPSFVEEREKDYLQLIKPALSNQSTVVVRGNLRVTNPDATGFVNLKDEYEDLLAKETTQLWKIDIYKPVPPTT
jgi:S-adenosylmethionine-diacylglycerol 3-amino-3-carboxypropyl transferase